ncbi:MAG TPA: D-alanyl-D-alanine carboxypeptidase [Geobacter sp.]|nr:D-alanyl-D-alanine carboxypeptidase [Geobacter sp.]
MKFLPSIAGCTIAVFLLSGTLACQADAAVSPFANPPSAYLLQVNGRTYRERNPDKRRAPASLTKIMTALVIMEQLDMDEVVTVSRSAARETGSRIGLRRGERLKVRDLLAATLMTSANDACRALADHAGGSQKAFVAQMNARARRLDLENTRFSNACGHDNAGLFSTAHDLAVLTERALQIPLFADLVARRSMRIATVNGRRSFYLKNKNRLIGRYPGARGVKTGTTPNAGQCLVALAERDDRKVLLVIMHARNRWRTAPAMLDAAFAASSTAIATSGSKRIKAARDNSGSNKIKPTRELR